MYGWTFLGMVVIAIAAWLLVSGFIRTWRLYHGMRHHLPRACSRPR
jgi:hypothetical protein